MGCFIYFLEREILFFVALSSFFSADLNICKFSVFCRDSIEEKKVIRGAAAYVIQELDLQKKNDYCHEFSE